MLSDNETIEATSTYSRARGLIPEYPGCCYPAVHQLEVPYNQRFLSFRLGGIQCSVKQQTFRENGHHTHASIHSPLLVLPPLLKTAISPTSLARHRPSTNAFSPSYFPTPRSMQNADGFGELSSVLHHNRQISPTQPKTGKIFRHFQVCILLNEATYLIAHLSYTLLPPSSLH